MKFTLPKVLLLTLLPLFAFAQENYYQASTFSRTYEPLTNPTMVFDGIEFWETDEATYPLGFDFTIKDKTVSTLYGEGLPFLATDLNLNQNTAGIAFGLIDTYSRVNAQGQFTSSVSYKTEGEPGNRIFKLQIQNAGFYEEMDEVPYDQQSYFNLQLWLYEADNSIELSFGDLYFNGNFEEITETVGPLLAALNGFVDEGEDFDESWFVTGTFAEPTIAYTPDPEQEEDLSHILINGAPSSNQVYRLSPSGAVSTKDTKIEPLHLFPTLASSTIQLQGINTWEHQYSYQITDISGKIITSQPLTDNTIDVTTYNNGMYFITISQDNHPIKRGKFIKQ